MKRIKLLALAIIVHGIAGSVAAFNTSKYFSDGTTFCLASCNALQQRAFKIDPTGATANPCAGSSFSTTPYYIDGNFDCKPTIAGTTKFKATNTIEIKSVDW
jgi:hypothetical protein